MNNRLSLIIIEYKYIFKMARTQLLYVFVMFLMLYLLPYVARTQILLRNIEEIAPDASNVILSSFSNTVLPLTIPFMVGLTISSILQFIDFEKRDKVFEQIFLLPFHNLEIFYLRFVSSALVSISQITFFYIVFFISLLFTGGAPPISGMISVMCMASLLTFPILYVVYFAMHILQSQHVKLIRISIFLPTILFPSLLMSLQTESNMFNPNIYNQIFVGLSLFFSVIALILHWKYKRKIVEKTIINSW